MPDAHRSAVSFRSGRDECSGWLYHGTNGAGVVMATGAGITKEPGADRFAERFAAAGYTVLTFDYRRFGSSDGAPRQVLRVKDQVADVAAALSFIARQPDVDESRIALWGFSLGGGHVLQFAAEMDVAAVIAQTPFTDGLIASAATMRHETVGVVAAMPLLGLWDWLRGLVGRAPRLIPLAGKRGRVALLTTTDAQMGEEALRGRADYPHWTQSIAARSVVPLSWYRPGRRAQAISCPLLVVVADDDQSVLAAPALKAARQAPRGELFRVAGVHYAPFMEQHEVVIEAELNFLQRTFAAAAL